jgi:23S rRNA pseudouridine1911/1915/1917 synthase
MLEESESANLPSSDDIDDLWSWGQWNNNIPMTFRNKIQQAAKAGCILVNGKPEKQNYKVKPFDIISVLMAHPPREIELIPEDIPLNICYEDDDIVIVNKHAGLVVHPAFGNYTGTLVNALMFHFQNQRGRDEEPPRPMLVHRIDKNTSGIMIVAKNEYAQIKLANDFFHHTIDRKYLALVWGDFKEEEGTITGNIGRNPKDRLVMTVFPDGEEGKHAVTHYKVVERFGYVTLLNVLWRRAEHIRFVYISNLLGIRSLMMPLMAGIRL